MLKAISWISDLLFGYETKIWCKHINFDRAMIKEISKYIDTYFKWRTKT